MTAECIKTHPEAEITDWSAWQLEGGDIVLVGRVSGREGFDHGEWARTSRVQDCNLATGDAFTCNTRYLLGVPDQNTVQVTTARARQFRGMQNATLLDWHQRGVEE